MPSQPAVPKPQFFRSSRGDTSVLLVFLILAALLLVAMALVVLSIGNLRGAGNIAVSSQALYAADVGIERGLNDYRWSNPTSTTCTRTSDDVPVGSARYELIVRAHDSPTGCPTFAEFQDGRKALCVEAIGKARGGAVRRRVTNDTDSFRCGRP